MEEAAGHRGAAPAGLLGRFADRLASRDLDAIRRAGPALALHAQQPIGSAQDAFTRPPRGLRPEARQERFRLVGEGARTDARAELDDLGHLALALRQEGADACRLARFPRLGAHK